MIYLVIFLIVVITVLATLLYAQSVELQTADLNAQYWEDKFKQLTGRQNDECKETC